jgi:transposase
MKFKLFVGIDVSKSTIDVYVRNGGLHSVFPNREEGFLEMIEWIQGNAGNISVYEILFAFEHTGLYSYNLAIFLDENNYSFSMIAGLELKRSRGISRGKSDKSDARVIAEYAFEKKEKLKLYKLPSKTMERLKKLLSYRERLVKEKTAYTNRLQEYEEILPEEELAFLSTSHREVIGCLKKQIGIVEKELFRLVKEDKELLKQYNLINTIKGVGPQTAMLMIVLTNGFTLFESWRKFASYAGTAPFPNQSGVFKGRTKTSKLANKRIKTLLSLCAATAIQHNPEMKQYYERRLMEGKNEMSTINIIRNKILSRIFAVINRETPYVDIFKFAA